MPISLIDDQGNELDLDKADGGTLRRKLEEAIAQNRDLEREAATFRAEKAIEAHGSDLVKPEDLMGVSKDGLEAKVQELHEQRLDTQKETVRTVLAKRGLEGDELEAAVEEFLGGDSDGSPVPAGDAFDDLDGLGGARPDRKPNLPDMEDGFGNLESYFAEHDK